MNKQLRVGVIGVGHMGRHHARIYSQLDRCRLVAVIDKDLDRARRVASEYGGQAASCPQDLGQDLDAVTVAVPTVYHAEVAIPLLERGTAVLVEKPLAPDTTSAKQLLEASRKCHCLLQVGHSERFNPVVQAMLRMAVTPRFVETQRVSPFTFRSADIGVVFDMMIHDIDIVLHLVKRRDYTIDAVGVNVLGPCEDVANARIRFGDETVVNLTASRLALKTERKIRIFCPTAYLSMDYQKKSGIAVKLADNVDLIRLARQRNFEDLSQIQHFDFGSMVKVEPLKVGSAEPLHAEIESFLDSVITGSKAEVSADDGYAAVELAQRITEIVRAQAWSTSLATTIGS